MLIKRGQTKCGPFGSVGILVFLNFLDYNCDTKKFRDNYRSIHFFNAKNSEGFKNNHALHEKK